MIVGLCCDSLVSVAVVLTVGAVMGIRYILLFTATNWCVALYNKTLIRALLSWRVSHAVSAWLPHWMLGGTVPLQDDSSSAAVHHLNFVDKLSSPWVAYCCIVFHLGHDKGFVSSLSYSFRGILEVSFSKAQGLVGLGDFGLYMGVPLKL